MHNLMQRPWLHGGLLTLLLPLLAILTIFICWKKWPVLFYWLLLAGLFVFASIGFGLFFSRMKEMPKVPVEHSVMSREFALFLGASAITARQSGDMHLPTSLRQ